MSIIKVDPILCNKDFLCVRECPVGILTIDKNKLPITNPELEQYCLHCGHCQAVCPCDALTLHNVAPQDCPVVLKDNLDWTEIENLIRSRRSIRRYKKKLVEPAILDKLLEVTRWAPTGGNSQLVNWIVIEQPESIKKIIFLTAEWARTTEMFKFLAEAWDKGHDAILRGAPQLVIAHAGNEYGSTVADCIIATTTLDLAAVSQGIGTCWAGFFMIACAQGYKPLLDFLQLPANHKVSAALMIGYPEVHYKHIPERKPLTLRKM